MKDNKNISTKNILKTIGADNNLKNNLKQIVIMIKILASRN